MPFMNDEKASCPVYRTPNLHVYGIGVEYPSNRIKPEDIATLAKRHYPSSPALEKVIAINQRTGIDCRPAICNIDHPIHNAPQALTIAELSDLFLTEGVKLSVAACQKALKQWGGSLSKITHVVATTCTNSANPGYDHYVVRELGVKHNVEKILLHGVGCAGGLAALRTAAGLALGFNFLQKPARILVLACELTSVLARSELDHIHREQEVGVGVTLFGDCASAVILGNGLKENDVSLLELLDWEHRIIHGTELDLGFNVNQSGWKVVLSQRLPQVASAALPSVLKDLITRTPDVVGRELDPSMLDWALHPGGAAVLSGVEKAMGLQPNLLRASYDVYKTFGNSSSATIFSVLQRLLEKETTEHIVGCAFGPGIAIEVMLFARSRQPPVNNTIKHQKTAVASFQRRLLKQMEGLGLLKQISSVAVRNKHLQTSKGNSGSVLPDGLVHHARYTGTP